MKVACSKNNCDVENFPEKVSFSFQTRSFEDLKSLILLTKYLVIQIKLEAYFISENLHATVKVMQLLLAFRHE